MDGQCASVQPMARCGSRTVVFGTVGKLSNRYFGRTDNLNFKFNETSIGGKPYMTINLKKILSCKNYQRLEPYVDRVGAIDQTSFAYSERRAMHTALHTGGGGGGATIWNSLPNDCRTAHTFPAFKVKLKAMLA